MKNLKDYLKKNGITQVGFARRLGIDRQTLHAYLKGNRKMPLSIKKLTTLITQGEVTFDEK